MGESQSTASIAIAPGKHRPLGLNPEDLLDMYSKMVLTRVLDQRVWALNRQGKVAIVGSCSGHEGAQVGAMWAMDRSRDIFFTFYRDLCALLTLGVTPKEILLGYMAKTGEPMSGGRMFPGHGVYPKYRIINLSNVVAAQMTKAVGAALASKLRKEPTVVFVSFGDGATSEGEWHEALNFAGVHRLPILFFCENNRWAISVPVHKQMAVPDVAVRAQGYGFPGVVVDGTDPLEVLKATREAAERARNGGGPTLIEAKVERLMPHTSDDDDRRYRPKEDLERAKARDPIDRFRAYLQGEGVLTESQDKAIWERATAEVNEATEFADKAPFPDPSTLLDHIWATPPGRKGV